LDRCIRWRECRRSIGDHSVEELSNWNLQGDTWDIGKTNFTGGAQASYNYQADSFVWGIEAELGYLGLNDSATQPGSEPFGFDTHAEIDGGLFSTVRGRTGFAADRFLPYLTGGIAFADLKDKVIDDCNTGPCGSDLLSISNQNWQFGWTVGGGFEHAATDQLRFKAEYLYMDFGSQKVDGYSTTYNDYASYNFDQKVRVVRVGLSYSF
jgi:outer membrane immunogenic protein